MHALGIFGSEKDRPWLSSYARGVNSDIDFAGRSSPLDVFAQSVEKWPDRVAVQCLGSTITYRELDAMCHRLAAGFQALGLPAGARVALMMPSAPQYLACQIALMRCGMVAVNVNPLYTPRELLHQLRDSGSEALVVLESFTAAVESVLRSYPVRHVIVTRMGDTMSGLKALVVNAAARRSRQAKAPANLPGHRRLRDLLRAAPKPSALVRPAPSDLAMLQYTGGTTGVAKGAMLTHRNLLAASLQADAFFQAALQAAPSVEVPVLLVPLPLYHVFTIYVTMVGLGCGARIVLVPNPRDIDGLVRTMKATPFHLMTGLNTLYRALADHPGIKEVDFSPCRVFVAGGTATQSAVVDRWQALTGRWIVEGWGMTETSGGGACNPPWSNSPSRGIGVPFPSTHIAIRDVEGRPVPTGATGEICIAGPQVMSGYWGRVATPAEVSWPDGFLRTGDVGLMESDGFIRIVDRLKDMALVSGFNVYPTEIEDVVATHPGVAEAAAVSVPDSRTGEAIRLFVVRRDHALTEAQVRQHCIEGLTAYKRPRDVVFVDALPKSAVGKILRRELPVD